MIKAVEGDKEIMQLPYVMARSKNLQKEDMAR